MIGVAKIYVCIWLIKLYLPLPSHSYNAHTSACNAQQFFLITSMTVTEDLKNSNWTYVILSFEEPQV